MTITYIYHKSPNGRTFLIEKWHEKHTSPHRQRRRDTSFPLCPLHVIFAILWQSWFLLFPFGKPAGEYRQGGKHIHILHDYVRRDDNLVGREVPNGFYSTMHHDVRNQLR